MGWPGVSERTPPEVAPALAIDSASPEAGVAVLRGDELVAERQWTLETTFSLELLAAIDGVLADAGVTKDELAAIVVAVGPGGYSGLRTGVATAQGLALALDLPLAGVSRLEAQAYPHLAPDRPVIAVHDPGRGQIAWAAYAQGRPAPEVVVAARIDSAERCVALAPPGALWCGELTDELRAALDAALAAAGRAAEAEPPADNSRRAADLVRLARLHDAYGDPAEVDVVYLRPPNITKPRAEAKP
jgi:tRNA threonylcarbamoyl adenosine modification protein YeaZ